jgi:hypothetical protein
LDRVAHPLGFGFAKEPVVSIAEPCGFWEMPGFPTLTNIVGVDAKRR